MNQDWPLEKHMHALNDAWRTWSDLYGSSCCACNTLCHLAPAALPAACRSQRVNSVQRLRHSLLRADRLLEKHEDEVRWSGVCYANADPGRLAAWGV